MEQFHPILDMTLQVRSYQVLSCAGYLPFRIRSAIWHTSRGGSCNELNWQSACRQVSSGNVSSEALKSSSRGVGDVFTSLATRSQSYHTVQWLHAPQQRGALKSTSARSNCAFRAGWPVSAEIGQPWNPHNLNSNLGGLQRHSVPVRAIASSASIELEALPDVGLTGNSSAESYDADSIQVLPGLEPVRRRPGMYIGSTGVRGLHHLIYEVVDNAIDEVQGGHASTVDVELLPDGGVRVRDDGRGIPVDVHAVTGKSALETVLTVLHAGGKFGGESSGYRVSGGLHGVGVSVVNALSRRLEVTVWRDGAQYSQAYEQGVPVTELLVNVAVGGEEADPSTATPKRGTEVAFWPDPVIFTSTLEFDYNTVATRLRELAFLNPEVTIRLTAAPHLPLGDPSSSRAAGTGAGGSGSAQASEFHFAGGLREYVQWMTAGKDSMHDVIAFRREHEGVVVDAALLWCSDSYSDTLLGYANSVRTADGGTHLEGARAAITRVLNSIGRRNKILKDKEENLVGEHIREGLTAIVAVKVANAEFEGQTKTRLGNPEVRRAVDAVMGEALQEVLERNPLVLDAILSKAMQAFKAAQAAKRARELVRRKSALRSSMLPGKLADCSCSDPKQAEIFIVEGDSAGGSAKQGRDRRFQAVLPLRGKILNIERKDESAIYKNAELQSLILALGLGIKGESYALNQLRYNKIIILTDADVDGAHIRTLLLTFLYRYQPGLFENGHVFVGMPPLYKVEHQRQAHYCYDDASLDKLLRETLPPGATTSIQRFKGLGEMMPTQLWETTLDPSSRLLKLVTVDNAAEAHSTLSILMGNKVAPRKELIQRMASSLKPTALDF